MNKISGIALFYLLLSSAALATEPSFNGFYGSLDLGMTNSHVKDKQFYEATLPIAPGVTIDIKNTANLRTKDNSLTGGVSLGYAKTFNQIFLMGLEGRANFEDLYNAFDRTLETPANVPNAAIVSIPISTHTELKNDFSLLMKLGILLQPNTLLYGVVGPAWGHFNVDSHASFSENVPGVFTFKSNDSDSESMYSTGLLFGLGMEYLVSEHISFSLEYTHVNYKKLNADNLNNIFLIDFGNTGDFEPLPGSSLQYKNDIQPQTNNIVLGLTYYLG